MTTFPALWSKLQIALDLVPNLSLIYIYFSEWAASYGGWRSKAFPIKVKG